MMRPCQPIGHNMLAKVGVHFAEKLGKKNPSAYTGHFARRTAATILADRGATLTEIKNVTGHKSDTVVQGYINKSSLTKHRSAMALTMANGRSMSAIREMTMNDLTRKPVASTVPPVPLPPLPPTAAMPLPPALHPVPYPQYPPFAYAPYPYPFPPPFPFYSPHSVYPYGAGGVVPGRGVSEAGGVMTGASGMTGAEHGI